MRRFCVSLFTYVTFLALTAALRADDPPQGIEVDARGPVHEAYAQPYQPDPVLNEPVEKQPPAPIPEEPAAERPEGQNVQWIPGYWQWDGDRNDFVWVSGFWRDAPAQRHWVMGYWANTDAGYRWVPGHWAGEGEKEEVYVPEPPQVTDQGPTTPAPDDQSFYIPGTYFYGESGFTYRNGYWADCRPGYVWTPAQYDWTPYGYRYCSGYWDYALADRGLLFAPVYFTSALWTNPGWHYRPHHVVPYGGLYNSFFVGPRVNHYFFGDYYARSYLNRGIQPWHSYANRRYDPIWAYDRWNHRGNPQWAAGLQSQYTARVNGTAALPPRTFAAQRANAGAPRTVNTLAEVRQSGVRLNSVSVQQQTTIRQAARQMVDRAVQLSSGAPRTAAVPHRGNAAGAPNRPFAPANPSGEGNRAAANPNWTRPGAPGRTPTVNPNDAGRLALPNVDRGPQRSPAGPSVTNRPSATPLPPRVSSPGVDPGATRRSATPPVNPGVTGRSGTPLFNPNANNPGRSTAPQFNPNANLPSRPVVPNVTSRPSPAPRVNDRPSPAPFNPPVTNRAPTQANRPPSVNAPRSAAPSFNPSAAPRNQGRSYTPAFQPPSIRAPANNPARSAFQPPSVRTPAQSPSRPAFQPPAVRSPASSPSRPAFTPPGGGNSRGGNPHSPRGDKK